MKLHHICLILCGISSCISDANNKLPTSSQHHSYGLDSNSTAIIVLGTVQDAGSPHIACTKECCRDLFDQPDADRQVVALGIVDNTHQQKYLVEATPDISKQMKALVRSDIQNTDELVDAIFLTHAHIGHYTGLMYLGKEATNARRMSVYAMPRMKNYLDTNGPWSQLVSDENIVLTQMTNKHSIPLSSNLSLTPFTVPHRDEYSETVGYKIVGPNKTALFIPDIDKWEKWKKNIIEEIQQVDYAFLDATFYSGKEINNRDIKEIPHPFIIESLNLFEQLDEQNRNKVIFIHLNHTNPALNPHSIESKHILDQGYRIARIHEVYLL